MTELQTTVLEQTNPLKPLAGKVAVVTGASRGIGAEIAKAVGKEWCASCR